MKHLLILSSWARERNGMVKILSVACGSEHNDTEKDMNANSVNSLEGQHSTLQHLSNHCTVLTIIKKHQSHTEDIILNKENTWTVRWRFSAVPEAGNRLWQTQAWSLLHIVLYQLFVTWIGSLSLVWDWVWVNVDWPAAKNTVDLISIGCGGMFYPIHFSCSMTLTHNCTAVPSAIGYNNLQKSTDRKNKAAAPKATHSAVK